MSIECLVWVGYTTVSPVNSRRDDFGVDWHGDLSVRAVCESGREVN